MTGQKRLQKLIGEEIRTRSCGLSSDIWTAVLIREIREGIALAAEPNC